MKALQKLLQLVRKSLSKAVMYFDDGATTGIWTQDLILTMDALYQLSYRGGINTFAQRSTHNLRFTQELSRSNLELLYQILIPRQTDGCGIG